MNTSFRSPRISRTYLSRIVEEGRSESVLAPDITTERLRQPPVARRPEPASAPELSVIETRHPDIARAISLLWGYPEMNEYFSRLWLADGQQEPIDPDAMSELMLLARLHHAVMPQASGRSLAAIYGSDLLHAPSGANRDPWGEVPARR